MYFLVLFPREYTIYENIVYFSYSLKDFVCIVTIYEVFVYRVDMSGFDGKREYSVFNIGGRRVFSILF